MILLALGFVIVLFGLFCLIFSKKNSGFIGLGILAILDGAGIITMLFMMGVV